MSAIDTRVVRRSCYLRGNDVAYQEFLRAKGAFAPLRAFAMAAVAGILSKAMAFSSFREMAKKSALSGLGPSSETMDAGWFHCTFLGRNLEGRTARVTMSGQGDPANRITVKCLCESALCLACDAHQLPCRAEILTPSTGLGETLVNRLRERGINISIENTW